MLEKINLSTPPKESILDITPQIRNLVRQSGVKEGLCVVFVPHSTAAITVNSALDPATAQDVISDIKRLIPTRIDFNHTYDTPSDAAGHIKSTLIGISTSIIVHDGDLMLGGSQFVMFCEYDGPRNREVLVRIMADG